MASKSQQNKQDAAATEMRKTQLAELDTAVTSLEQYQATTKAAWTQLTQLESVADGVYDEIDKLTKKAPAETVTGLALEQINDIIRETKEASPDDKYLQRLKEFVPAGDNPELRDALMVLRQVREGLKRLRGNLESRTKQAAAILPEARFLLNSLRHHFDYGSGPSHDALENLLEDEQIAVKMELIKKWSAGGYGARHFNYDKLDALNIPDYFKVG